jgi:hypothetical protein
LRPRRLALPRLQRLPRFSICSIPYDASASDLVVHVFAVALVIAANRAYGGRMLHTATA